MPVDDPWTNPPERRGGGLPQEPETDMPKRFILLILLFGILAGVSQAAGPFSDPIGAQPDGFLVLPIFAGGLPLGLTIV